jgi:hypothetical protein
LQAGDNCLECGQGTIYLMPPATFLRFVGLAPVQATIYERERLRCSLCGTVFTAALPEGVDDEKYDPTVAIMIALLKYGRGLPFNRLRELQDSVGIPLPAGTQWQLVEELAHIIRPVYEELMRQAAQGDVLYHDDTVNRILSLMGKRRAATLAAEESLAGGEATLDPDPHRDLHFGSRRDLRGASGRGLLHGRHHAGENLRDVLDLRARELEPPIQMCDPLSRNMPADLKTILANCLAHARRQFVDVVEYFSDECEYVLHALEGVYKNDETARRDKLSPEERLKFHQTHSEAIMTDLKEWLQRQFDERLVEPNSALGKAITYLQNHWDPFTLFLRKAGAPLDNNICERALKKVILHRKNSLFYKTRKGSPRRRPVHESDLHLRSGRIQSLRLLPAVGSSPEPAGQQPGGLDALELPADRGVSEQLGTSSRGSGPRDLIARAANPAVPCRPPAARQFGTAPGCVEQSPPVQRSAFFRGRVAARSPTAQRAPGSSARRQRPCPSWPAFRAAALVPNGSDRVPCTAPACAGTRADRPLRSRWTSIPSGPRVGRIQAANLRGGWRVLPSRPPPSSRRDPHRCRVPRQTETRRAKSAPCRHPPSSRARPSHPGPPNLAAPPAPTCMARQLTIHSGQKRDFARLPKGHDRRTHPGIASDGA